MMSSTQLCVSARLAVLAGLLCAGGANAHGYSMCVVPIPSTFAIDDMGQGFFDGLSFMATSTELHPPTHGAMSPGTTSGLVAPDVPEDAGWEAQFAWGLYHSQKFLELEEPSMSSWATDDGGSGAGVPVEMLRAEGLLKASEGAPPEQAKAKLAERALRLYYHAKWLAERNHATAAEFRYRHAADLAKRSRRSVLASHALSRLGYFLVQWARHEEALEALEEAERLNGKSNPLAPYLHAVLKRRNAGADTAAIKEAEDRILAASKLPSDELEVERALLSQEITYWRTAETAPQHCLRTLHAAHALICLCGHGGLAVRQAVEAIR